MSAFGDEELVEEDNSLVAPRLWTRCVEAHSARHHDTLSTCTRRGASRRGGMTGVGRPHQLLSWRQSTGQREHQPFRDRAFISEGSLSFRCNFRLETDDDFPKLKKERQLPTGDFFILF